MTDRTRPSIIAMIPARSGSKRVVGKNVRPLNGHPLIAYTVRAAIESGVFDDVIVSTDSDEYAEIARRYGAETPFLRPPEFSTDSSPDVEWVVYTLRERAKVGRSYDCFSILRPTSPCRKPETIRRAWGAFQAAEGVDSLRAVEPCSQHPGKMWVIRGGRLFPVLPISPEEKPWHSQQTQFLPAVHVQNASLEIAWTRVALEGGTIAGSAILPFITEEDEGLDVNTERDWFWLEHLLERAEASLPEVREA